MISQGARIREFNSQHRRPPIAAMYTFSDEVLLKIFYHSRPALSLADEHEPGDNRNLEGRKWDNERWWYKLVRVCRRWRRLVLASASYLRLSLHCTYGTPVAEILTYPPALPLIIDYGDKDREVAAQDEEGILLALRCHHRVRRIRFWVSSPSLRRLLATMDGEFPMLEDLYIKPLTNDDTDLSLPDTFNAPNLRHFVVRNVTYSPVVLHRPPPTHHVPSTERISQSTLCYGPQLWRSLRIFIHILDDDSLLNIFNFCRPVMVDEDTSISRILQGGEWHRERWWYKFVHVCRRWRTLILVSASHLNLCLVCAPGTPVADMLTNSPPLPLIIDHIHYEGSITAKDEEGIILALQHRNRVRRIRLLMHIPDLHKLLPALDEEFPMLEYLYMMPLTKSMLRSTTLPNTFQAPHLRHLVLSDVAFPIRSPLITAGTGVTTLSLQGISQSESLHPNDLLQQISLMPQLETLRIFCSTVPNRDLERQLMQWPVTTHVTLPNLRWLGLRLTSTYMESLLPRMTTPLLERLEVWFFSQHNLPVSHLLKFMAAAENLRFGSAKLRFLDNAISARMYPHGGTQVESFSTDIPCVHIGWQVLLATQIFCSLNTVFSGVEHLTLECPWGSKSLEINNGVDRTQWRELLRSFSNVKVLRMSRDFLEHISRSLQVDEGESPLELLPELKELQCSQFLYGPNPFGAFIDARRNAGRPVKLVRY